jgi:hypothetical protein
MVPQHGTHGQASRKIAQGLRIVRMSGFSRPVPLNSRGTAGRIAAARRVSAYPFFSGAMGNKNNNKVTFTACA